MRVQPLGFTLDAVGLVFLPVAIDVGAPQFQHRLRPRRRPVHPRALHPVLHQVTTRPFNHSTGLSDSLSPGTRRNASAPGSSAGTRRPVPTSSSSTPQAPSACPAGADPA